jgi:pimeloyl-ACP methyl ester carboxylesterase
MILLSGALFGIDAAVFVKVVGLMPAILIWFGLGLMGSSFGGMASVLAAPFEPGLICLALKSPVSDYLGKLIAERDRKSLGEWRERGFLTLADDEGRSLRLNYSFYEDAAAARGYESAPGIRIPTLIVHGSEDETVPVAQSRRLAELLPQGELEILAGADHRYSRSADFEGMLRRVSGFLADHLLATGG